MRASCEGRTGVAFWREKNKKVKLKKKAPLLLPLACSRCCPLLQWRSTADPTLRTSASTTRSARLPAACTSLANQTVSIVASFCRSLHSSPKQEKASAPSQRAFRETASKTQLQSDALRRRSACNLLKETLATRARLPETPPNASSTQVCPKQKDIQKDFSLLFSSYYSTLHAEPKLELRNRALESDRISHITRLPIGNVKRSGSQAKRKTADPIRKEARMRGLLDGRLQVHVGKTDRSAAFDEAIEQRIVESDHVAALNWRRHFQVKRPSHGARSIRSKRIRIKVDDRSLPKRSLRFIRCINNKRPNITRSERL